MTPSPTDIEKSSDSSINIEQSLTKPYEPTPLMIKWFETSLDLGHTASISDVAEKSEVSRGSWYVWVKDPEFVKWWDEQWNTYFVTNKWKLRSIGMKQAEKNYDYWHDMMTASGQLEEGGKAPNVQVNNFIAGKKNEYGL